MEEKFVRVRSRRRGEVSGRSKVSREGAPVDERRSSRVRTRRRAVSFDDDDEDEADEAQRWGRESM